MADETVQTGIISTEAAQEVAEVNQEQVQNPEQAQEAAPEAAEPEKIEAKPEQTEEDKRFATKFAALSRKEKAIREQERRLSAKMKEIDSKLAQLNSVKPEVKPVEEPLERRIRKDPFKTLESLGVNYETLTKIALNDGKLTPELQMQLMREEIESNYKSEVAELKKRLEERETREQQEREQATLNNFKADIANIISTEASNYELLAAEGQEGVDRVFEVIDQHFQETGEVADIKEAITAVEEFLLEEAKKRIGLGKIRKLMEPSQEKVPTKPEQPQKKPSATLSNQASQVQPTTGRFLSDEESKREAAKLIKFDA